MARKFREMFVRIDDTNRRLPKRAVILEGMYALVHLEKRLLLQLCYVGGIRDAGVLRHHLLIRSEQSFSLKQVIVDQRVCHVCV